MGTVRKVKGHTDEGDIKKVITTETERNLNIEADGLAVKGSETTGHEFAPELLYADKQEGIFTQLVQRMMISVARARREHRDATQALIDQEKEMDELYDAYQEAD